MLAFAAPYACLLALFLLVVIVDAVIGIANPLIYRQIINKGILKRERVFHRSESGVDRSSRGF